MNRPGMSLSSPGTELGTQGPAMAWPSSISEGHGLLSHGGDSVLGLLMRSEWELVLTDMGLVWEVGQRVWMFSQGTYPPTHFPELGTFP